MKLILLSFLILLFPKQTVAYTASPLFQVDTNDLIEFKSHLEKESVKYCNFYYESHLEIQENRTDIRGFVYYKEDLLYLKLFYFVKENDIRSFEPILIEDQNCVKNIRRFFYKVTGYPSNKCYTNTLRINLDNGMYSKKSKDGYYNYSVRYLKNNKRRIVDRDKLAIDDDSECMSSKRMLKERNDFQNLIDTINSVLSNYSLPLLE